MNYRPAQLQAAVFLTAIDFSSKLNIANMVRAHAQNLLDVDPLILPLPPDVPPQFPHIVIKNETNGWAFQMASGRFDLVLDLSAQQVQSTLSEVSAKLDAIALSIWSGLASQFGARANRLASVISVSSEVENAPEVVRQRYLNSRYGAGAHQSQVHLLHQIETEGYNLNRWVRLITMPADQKFPSRLLMEVDINTQAERPIDVTETTVSNFFQLANRQTMDACEYYLVG